MTDPASPPAAVTAERPGLEAQRESLMQNIASLAARGLPPGTYATELRVVDYALSLEAALDARGLELARVTALLAKDGEVIGRLIATEKELESAEARLAQANEALNECAWLIECSAGSEPVYARLKNGDEAHSDYVKVLHSRGIDEAKKLKPWHFVKDAGAATRFARKDDAFRVMQALGMHETANPNDWLKPTEHMWPTPPAQSAGEEVAKVLAAELVGVFGGDMRVDRKNQMLVKRAGGLLLKQASALNDALEFLDNYVDVVDGDYGKPEPNRAMSLTMQIKEVLGHE